MVRGVSSVIQAVSLSTLLADLLHIRGKKKNKRRREGKGILLQTSRCLRLSVSAAGGARREPERCALDLGVGGAGPEGEKG